MRGVCRPTGGSASGDFITGRRLLPVGQFLYVGEDLAEAEHHGSDAAAGTGVAAALAAEAGFRSHGRHLLFDGFYDGVPHGAKRFSAVARPDRLFEVSHRGTPLRLSPDYG